MDFSKINRIVYTRTQIWKDNQRINTYFCIVGRHEDGTCYYKNKYTEIPNEFGLVDEKIARTLFEKVLGSLKINIEAFEEGDAIHCDDYYSYQIAFDNSDDEYRMDKELSFWNPKATAETDLNDLTIRNIGDNCMGLWGHHYASINIDELRKDVTNGFISFARFYNHRVENMVSKLDDYIESEYWVKEDGNLYIIKSVEYNCICKSTEIIIDRNGYILDDGGYPYVHALKNNNVRVVYGL